MKVLKEFVIPFLGLKVGSHHFEFEVDKKFFDHFGYDDLNDADVQVEVELTKKVNMLELVFLHKGSVNVDCHLTNEPFAQPVNGEYKLVVKFGDEFNNEEDDLLILPHGSHEVDVSKYIYETIVLSIPAKCIHPGVEDGSLKSEMLAILDELQPNRRSRPETEVDPRWEKLKNLLTDKK